MLFASASFLLSLLTSERLFTIMVNGRLLPEDDKMNDTKENILMTALRLFAKDGYEAVSVRSIAGELGITKGALYKHYKNKRDIFDSIVERMYEIDAQRALEYKVPTGDGTIAYENASMDCIKRFTLAQFSFWSEAQFSLNVRTMLTLEQYRKPEMAYLYRNCITAGPVAYMEEIFQKMILKGILKEADPKQLAVEFYAPLYLLVSISDWSNDRGKCIELLNHHSDRLIRCNAAVESLKEKEISNEIFQK